MREATGRECRLKRNIRNRAPFATMGHVLLEALYLHFRKNRTDITYYCVVHKLQRSDAFFSWKVGLKYSNFHRKVKECGAEDED